MVNQLSVFVENKFGRMSAIANVLRDKNIDICALSLADASDFGLLRLIVDRPEEARDALKDSGVMVKMTPVVVASMENVPGGLAKLLEILTSAQINIEYMYAFIGYTEGKAWTVFKTDNNELAEKLFTGRGIPLMN